MGKATQPVSVEGIEFNALMSSTEKYEATVPEYSVETGYSVSDSIILNQETLEMTLLVSDRPITWRKRFGTGAGRVEDVVKRLKELYFQKQLVTVTTSTQTYTEMAITSISFQKTTDMMDAMEIPISFQKVRTTETKTATIPASYGKSGTTAASAGTASTSSGSTTSSASGADTSRNASSSSDTEESGKSGSILYHAASSLGLVK